MKSFVIAVELWFRLLASIIKSERAHYNQRVRWTSLVRRCWKARNLLSRIVAGDTTYIKYWAWTWDEPCLEHCWKEDNEALTLLDLVVGEPMPSDWYYLHVAWEDQWVPLPWVHSFYKL